MFSAAGRGVRIEHERGSALGIESVAMPVRSDAEIETAVATLGAEQAGPFARGASKLQVRNAPLATVGPKKAACRDGPHPDSCGAANFIQLPLLRAVGDATEPRGPTPLRS
jgi:hypothetical protein